eukprot:CAMPEP_0194481022 /NCGR_PEP_ID=MMETSP0253-20130528/3641_1 /TAXON_ID=2966 /ORGANISM="Noctiluca scintillans" /LENGTH=195 /DNA_ID=CAMNT_0039320481 /DNA_START=50 /DNA_END=637 /DNA_ORIENTATION=-
MRSSNENISPKVMHAVIRQVAMAQGEKLEGVHVVVNPDEPLDIQAVISGPTDTPYEGGTYTVKIFLGAEFPAQPPKAIFLTKIFHPNISAHGEVCVNTLKRDWDPSNWSIVHILQVIRCLLIVPFPESSLNEEAGRLFMDSYQEYAAHASMINRIHAAPAAMDTGAKTDCPADGEIARKEAQKKAQKVKKSLRRL